MEKKLPEWAMKMALPEDRLAVRDARSRGALRITPPSGTTLRDWAKAREWPTPWLGFTEAFVDKMLEEDASFELALRESGIELHVLPRELTLSAEQLRELDELYAERSPGGRPTRWGALVEELRGLRRIVEAGTVLRVGDARTLATWQDFYSWAHERYHALEDGADKWIGSDD